MTIAPDSTSTFLTLYRDRLARTAQSRVFVRVHRVALEQAADDTRLQECVPWLLRVALVEMTERPAPIRLAEWCAQAVVGRWRPFTCGPMQMRYAKFKLSEQVGAALLALSRVPDEDRNTAGVATHWHGAAVRQPGAAFSYPQALDAAGQILTVTAGEARRHGRAPHGGDAPGRKHRTFRRS